MTKAQTVLERKNERHFTGGEGSSSAYQTNGVFEQCDSLETFLCPLNSFKYGIRPTYWPILLRQSSREVRQVDDAERVRLLPERKCTLEEFELEM